MEEFRNMYGQFVCTKNDSTGEVVIAEGRNMTIFVLRPGESIIRVYKNIKNVITRTNSLQFVIESYPIAA